MKSIEPAYGIRHTAYGIRHTAYGIRHTAYGIRHTAKIFGRFLGFVKPLAARIALFQPNSVVIPSIDIPSTVMPMTPAIRNIPVGSKDIPAGVKNIPPGAKNIPPTSGNIPPASGNIPHGVKNIPPKPGGTALVTGARVSRITTIPAAVWNQPLNERLTPHVRMKIIFFEGA
jgi:hypothetical protein